eukprot:1187380-Prorocentrum_minimum.AAC.3
MRVHNSTTSQHYVAVSTSYHVLDGAKRLIHNGFERSVRRMPPPVQVHFRQHGAYTSGSTAHDVDTIFQLIP